MEKSSCLESGYNVTSDVISVVISKNSRNPSITDAKLRQGRSKKISCTCSGSFRYQHFCDKRKSLKARIHKTSHFMRMF